jgi:hypothetical protein
LDLRVEDTLPRGFYLKYEGIESLEKMVLKWGEERTLRWLISTPKRIPRQVVPPFEGKVVSKVYGEMAGRLEGELSEVQVVRRLISRLGRTAIIRINGTISGCIGEVATVTGRFYDDLDLSTSVIKGRIKGSAFFRGGKTMPDVELGLEGCLDPL